MTRLVLTFISFFTFFICFGQGSQDYIITMKSDTLKGEVRIMSYDLLDRIQFTVDKKKTTYTALQVRRISIRGEQFAPVKLDNSIRLMKVVRSGFMSLYAHRGPGQPGYDTKVIQKVGLNAQEVPNLGFKKFFGELIEDCPTVADKVKSGDLGRSDVETITEQYNVCISDFSRRRVETATVESTQNSPATELIDQMKTKVTASDLANKSEVNDLLTSIADRVKKKEIVPAYMKEGLKGYLASSDDLKGDLEQLLKLIE